MPTRLAHSVNDVVYMFGHIIQTLFVFSVIYHCDLFFQIENNTK